MINLVQEEMIPIVVSHEIDFAKSIVHWVLFMDFGLIAESDIPKAFFKNHSK